MKNTKIGTYFYNGESCNFEFATSISASDKVTFVDSVVNTIVDDNYHPTIRDMIFDYMLIQACSDVDVSFIRNSRNVVDAIENFLEETNIVDVIKSNMEVGIIDELNKAVDKSISYRTGIRSSPIDDSLAILFSAIEKKVNEFDMGNMMEMAQKFAGMTGELTPESIVNAYMNSDMHQKNVIEIEDAKKQRAEFAEDMDKAIKAVKEETDNNTKSKTKHTKK